MVILTPLPQKSPNLFMTTHHYVYHSYEEWGREYIGCRSCDCLPEEDTKYFGSFCDKTFFPTEKTILFVCETRKEVVEIEIKLHDLFDVAVNPQFANRSKQTSTKFDVAGVPWTEEQKEAQSERMSGENNPNYGVPKTEEWKKAHSERMSGKTHTEAQNKANSERMSGENNPMFGAPRTEEWKKAHSERMSGEKNPQYGRTGALSPTSKAIIAIEPDGTQRHFGSGREAARKLEIPKGTLSGYLKNGHVLTQGKWKDWQFIYKNSENF